MASICSSHLLLIRTMKPMNIKKDQRKRVRMFVLGIFALVDARCIIFHELNKALHLFGGYPTMFTAGCVFIAHFLIKLTASAELADDLYTHWR